MPQSEESPKRRLRQAERARRKQHTMLTWGLAAVALALIAGAVYFLSGSKPAGPVGVMPTKRLFAGEPMPDVGWRDLHGAPVRISDYAGKPLLINAWATWCPPCKAEMPMLQAFYEQYREQGLTVLAVDGGEELETVQAFRAANPFTFPVVLDESGAVLNALGIKSFPTSVVVGQDGLVKHLYIGQLTEQQLNQEIVAFLELK